MRLFIALDVEPEIQKVLAPIHSFLVGHSNLMKAVSPEDYHVTVKFLGECRKGLYEDIKKTFKNYIKSNVVVKYSLQGLGAFPDLAHANVVWAGIIPQGNEIKTIYASVESFAAGFGFPPEKRAFTPHLTLARVRRGMKLTSAAVQFIREREHAFFAESRFIRLALYSSTLTPKGPLYCIEEEIPL